MKRWIYLTTQAVSEERGEHLRSMTFHQFNSDEKVLVLIKVIDLGY